MIDNGRFGRGSILLTNETGHPWYHYDAKVVKEAWDETVTVN